MLELYEILAILAGIGPVLVAGIIGLQAYQFWKQGRERQRQTELDSARLVLDLDKEYRTEGFRKIRDKLYNRTIDLDDEEDRIWFLRYVNY